MLAFDVVPWLGQNCVSSLFKGHVAIACITVVTIATGMSWAPVWADNAPQVQACRTAFVDQKHAAPALAEQVCGCLFQLLPSDAAATVAAAVASPDGGADGLRELYARVQAQCRANACADPTPIDDTCDFDVAWAADAQGNHAKAIERYSRFIKNHPDLPAAISNRGQIYLEIGSYELAIADLQKAIAMIGDGNALDNNLYLAHAYHLVGRDAEALPLADAAINGYDKLSPRAYLYRAEIQESLGHSDAAIADYKRASCFAHDPKNLEGAQAGLKRLGAAPSAQAVSPLHDPACKVSLD